MNKFILGDCMDPEFGLPSYPDDYFDLAVVDVPYGIGENRGQEKSRNTGRVDKRNGAKINIRHKGYAPKKWDLNKPDSSYFKHLFRVSKNQIIWGANHLGNMPPSPCWIVFDKDNGASDFADCELAWTSFKSAVRKAKFRWSGMIQQDMKNREFRVHPTQKPVALYRWLLKTYANTDDLILDTHVGSASSLIACESMDFNYVGYEIDPDYYNAARNRMSKGIQKVLL